MRRFFVFLFSVALAGLIGIYLVHNHGSMIITFNDKMISMPLWLSVLGVVIALIVLRIIFIIVVKLFRLPFRIEQKLSKRRQSKAIALLQNTLRFVLIEDWLEVIQGTSKAQNTLKPLGLSHTALYFEIKGYIEQKQFLKAQNALKLFSEEQKQTIMYFWLQSQYYLKQNELEPALKVLEQAREKHPDASIIIKLYFEVLIKTQRYEKAVLLLDKLSRLKELDKETFRHNQLTAYGGYLDRAADNSPLAVQQAWEAVPRSLKAYRQIMCQYIEALLKQNQTKQAIDMLETAIKKNPGKEYIALLYQYDFNGEENKLLDKLLSKRLVNMRADDYMSVAKVQFKLKAYRSATEYIQKALHLEPSLNAYVLLAETYNRQNLLDKEAECYKKLHDLI